MKKDLSDYRFLFRKSYSDVQAQRQNGLVYITGKDVCDGNRYVLLTLLEEDFREGGEFHGKMAG